MNQVDQTIKNLQKNNFEVFHVATLREAENLFFDKILPDINPKSVSYGDSHTLFATSIRERINAMDYIDFIDTFEVGRAAKELHIRRKQALTVDLFLVGTNALTEKGQLVNMDMIGNRIGGINFGPRKTVILVSTNKIKKNLEEAMDRVRNVAAPMDTAQHESLNTPCQKTGYCMDCSSPDRICNTWLITEKSYPPGRIKIILIDEEAGF